MAEIKIKIPDMSCSHCEKRIRDAFANAEEATVKSLDLETKLVLVESELDSSKILEIIDEAGYDAEIL